MPPTRRKSAAPSQKTLAFGPRSKVTKPSAPSTTAAKKASQGPSHAPPVTKALSETSSRVSLNSTSKEKSEPERPLTPTNHGDGTGLLLKSPGGTLAIRQVRLDKPTKLENQALQIGDRELKKYWLRTEDERKAKAAHQGGLSLDEKILRHFDLSSQYGPCIGIERMKRWRRAHALGLRPPPEVLTVLLKAEEKNDKKAERAYIDELLTTRIGAGSD